MVKEEFLIGNEVITLEQELGTVIYNGGKKNGGTLNGKVKEYINFLNNLEYRGYTDYYHSKRNIHWVHEGEVIEENFKDIFLEEFERFYNELYNTSI